MRYLIAVVLAAGAAAIAAPPAEASGLPWVHNALCKVGVKKCRDLPPRPGPQTPCPEVASVGTIEVIFDKRLGGYVEWVCTEDGWRRTGKIVPSVEVPWAPPDVRKVSDWHRRCKSIVCGRKLVAHYYPTRWLLGRQ